MSFLFIKKKSFLINLHPCIIPSIKYLHVQLIPEKSNKNDTSGNLVSCLITSDVVDPETVQYRGFKTILDVEIETGTGESGFIHAQFVLEVTKECVFNKLLVKRPH